MVVAGVDSSLYELLKVVHIVAVVVAFAPVVAYPLLGSQLRREDEGAARRFFAAAAATGRTVHLPAFGLVGLLGFALVGLSDGQQAFADPWVGASIVLWLAAAGVYSAVVLPAQRNVAGGDGGAEGPLRIGSAAVSLILVVVVFLMVVKPG